LLELIHYPFLGILKLELHLPQFFPILLRQLMDSGDPLLLKRFLGQHCRVLIYLLLVPLVHLTGLLQQRLYLFVQLVESLEVKSTAGGVHLLLLLQDLAFLFQFLLRLEDQLIDCG
jgi:hypothetical protein